MGDLWLRSSKIHLRYASLKAGKTYQVMMANTLLTFGNRVRVKDLIEQIQNSQDAGALRDLIKPWYQAISDTPNGMYQADHLKEDLVKMLG